MKILFEFSTPLPVMRYGGTERLLFWHMKELARLGHEVVLVGHPKSRVREYGIRLIPWEDDWRRHTLAGIDVVHLFAPSQFEFDCPLIVTIGGNGQKGEVFHRNTVFVSRKHAEHHGSQSYVYNGIDLTEYPYLQGKQKEGHFLFLAHAKWKVKNVADCIRACRKAKKHLHIAGGRFWTFSRYIHSYGMVDQRKKVKLLQRTQALLFPVQWHEPFGIAVVEALAMGLPVIASPYGSMPELLSPKVGKLCQSYAEFEQCIANWRGDFDPEYLRLYAEENFSIQKMTRTYLELYQKVMRGEMLNAEPPQTAAQAGARWKS